MTFYYSLFSSLTSKMILLPFHSLGHMQHPWISRSPTHPIGRLFTECRKSRCFCTFQPFFPCGKAFTQNDRKGFMWKTTHFSFPFLRKTVTQTCLHDCFVAFSTFLILIGNRDLTIFKQIDDLSYESSMFWFLAFTINTVFNSFSFSFFFWFYN